MAFFNCMIHRLLALPLSTDDYNNELNIIKHIALANGYKSHIVDRIINKKQNKPINIDVSKEKVNKYIAIEYGENLYHTLKNQLKKHNITLASKASNKLEKKLTFTNKNIPSDIFDGTGVYRLNCSDCTQFYIRQTGRSFKLR